MIKDTSVIEEFQKRLIKRLVA